MRLDERPEQPARPFGTCPFRTESVQEARLHGTVSSRTMGESSLLVRTELFESSTGYTPEKTTNSRIFLRRISLISILSLPRRPTEFHMLARTR